ncbi:arylsulfatase [Saccharopolyspora phatthalungensis]|uniref:Arylsulfatase n=1 Tax=Saccharopolyspora phatthalungensis TaxID=664693 RepID=A0A840QGV2_9PSEU|nr:arylsulfatase [Saccharopolyspora phatthalungensis]MBB5159357.1 arylsulfatase [Saccharopolyspora phatthalungensis]
MTNVVLILADDLGYSDVGAYGGEIRTPNLDRLAAGGVRLTQFYNTARCSPSRASLLTGLHPQQTGIGILTNDESPTGYPGTLSRRCATAAEVLGANGFSSYLSGKWHLTNDVVNPNDAWPTRRGFDRFFGTLIGCGSYYEPKTLMRGEESAQDEVKDHAFFYTDAIADEGAKFIREHVRDHGDRPFFLYTAFTAPHWPLHAHEEDIAAYDGRYDDGWDELRKRRLARMVASGLLEEDTALSERDPSQPAWQDAQHKPWQLRRMQAYAAQVDRMDRGIGTLIRELEAHGILDDTLIIFLSDNGASNEDLPQGDPDRFHRRTDILSHETRDGRPVLIGNDPDVPPGGENTYASYGRAWANLSNTPFRYYKKWVHEGGIAAPFIAHWPAGGLEAGGIVRQPFQLVDVLPTLLEVTGSAAPDQELRLEGRSMLPAWRGETVDEADLYWEHCGNAAIRRDRWKLVRAYPEAWELYDLTRDRTELHDLAAQEPEVVAELAAAWEAWTARIGVIPFETTIAFYREMGIPEPRATVIASSEDYL